MNEAALQKAVASALTHLSGDMKTWLLEDTQKLLNFCQGFVIGRLRPDNLDDIYVMTSINAEIVRQACQKAFEKNHDT